MEGGGKREFVEKELLKGKHKYEGHKHKDEGHKREEGKETHAGKIKNERMPPEGIVKGKETHPGKIKNVKVEGEQIHSF